MKHVILMTGGTGLLGTVMTKHLYSQGHRLVIVGRSREKLDDLGASIQKNDPITMIEADLSGSEGIDNMIKELQNKNIFPTALINNARSLDFLKVDGLTGYTEREDFINEFTLDVITPYDLAFKLAHAAHSKLNNVINISSIYGMVPYNPTLDENKGRFPIQYSVAKAAVIHLTRELAIRFRKKVRVNCISYGGIEGRADQAFKERYGKLTPSGHMLTTGELTSAVDFLLSDGSSAVVGQNIVVDGGWTLW